MRKHELVAWLTSSIKRKIDDSCESSKKKSIISLRDDPSNQVIKIYSEIYNLKIAAEDENGREVEEMDEDTEKQIASEVVDNLIKAFTTEIEKLEY